MNLDTSRTNSSSFLSRALVFVTIVAAIAVIVAAVAVVRQSNRLDVVERRIGNGGLDRVAAEADGNPDNRHLTLMSVDGKQRLNVVLVASGNGFTVGGNLSDAPTGQRYQLWAMSNAQWVSLGLIGSTYETAAAFRLPSGATELMITLEPASASVVPSQPPVASARVFS